MSVSCAAVIMASAASCKKDNTLQYAVRTMCNITDGKIVSDFGNIYNIVENNCPGNIYEMDRAYIQCDLLNVTAGTEDEYDIRLSWLAKPEQKKPVMLGQAPSYIGKDPVKLYQGWFGGGYFNVIVLYPGMKDSKTEHDIDLIVDDSKSSKDKIYLQLRHNAHGDLPAADSEGQAALYEKCLTFRISDIIDSYNTNNEGALPVIVSYEWYKDDNSMNETTPSEVKGNYLLGGFEQK